MTSKCTIHEVEMPERESKDKVNEDGSPKTYNSHIQDGKMCFGEPLGKARRQGYTGSSAPKKEDKDVWDAKDRTFIAQTAWNAAAVISAARISGLNEDLPLEDIKSTADKIYKDILEKRNG